MTCESLAAEPFNKSPIRATKPCQHEFHERPVECRLDTVTCVSETNDIDADQDQGRGRLHGCRALLAQFVQVGEFPETLSGPDAIQNDALPEDRNLAAGDDVDAIGGVPLVEDCSCFGYILPVAEWITSKICASKKPEKNGNC